MSSLIKTKGLIFSLKTIMVLMGIRAGLILLSVILSIERREQLISENGGQSLDGVIVAMTPVQYTVMGWFTLFVLSEVLMTVITAVFFLSWVQRIYQFLEREDDEGMTFTPLNAVVGFLIPVSNLVHGYKVMKELWQLSDLSANTSKTWRTVEVPPLIGKWWGFFILSSILARATTFSAVATAADLPLYAISLGSPILGILAGKYAINLIGQISMRVATISGLETNMGAPITPIIEPSTSDSTHLEGWKQAVRHSPDDADTHYNLGTAYYEAGRYREAIEAYQQALQIKPDTADALLSIGLAYGELGEYDKEMEAYKQAIRLEPDYPEAHLYLGLAYMETKKRPLALEEYKVLKSLDEVKAEELFGAIYK